MMRGRHMHGLPRARTPARAPAQPLAQVKPQARALMAGAVLLSAAVVACAQTHSAPAPSTTLPVQPCPAPAEVRQIHLLGTWQAQFEGLTQSGTLLLLKHPEFEESFTGSITRGNARAQIAAEVERGGFTMEESADGTHISGTWVGDIVPGSCGREIRGVWQEEKDPPKPYPFVLRKMQGRW